VHPLRLALALLAGLAAATVLSAAPAVAAACTPHGAIGDYWRSIGGDASFLGPCHTDELPVRGGVVQHFRHGSVYWSAATGARETHGAIRGTYDASGAASSPLALPVTHEQRTPHRFGAFNHFQGGSIYWSPATGARVVRGAIRAAWAASGWENGPLGFPLTDEVPTPIKAGAFNHFEGGSIYWSPRTGAHLVYGDIRARWAGLGWENSALGYPVSDEYDVTGGRRSDFEGGSIVWDRLTRATRVIAGSQPSFTFSVHPVTAADLPSSWRAGCPVPPEQLRLLRMSHLGFDGADRTGELVVHGDQVDRVLRVFARMHADRFPVERMQKVDVYGGSDDASMEANNTSAFNCRTVAGSTAWSEHAYGRAIDINPVQNPYVRGTSVEPPAGRAYLDRGDVRPGMIVDGDVVVRSFTEQRWGWGGHFRNSKDYQHFSASGR
jgi:hypothetical protein